MATFIVQAGRNVESAQIAMPGNLRRKEGGRVLLPGEELAQESRPARRVIKNEDISANFRRAKFCYG